MSRRLLTYGWVAWMALRTEQHAMRSRPMVIVVSVIQPAVLMFLVAGTRSASPSRASVLVSAVVLTAVWTSVVWTAGGVLRRERTYGTLARSVTSVYSPSVVLFGKCLGATLYSLTAILASSAAAVALLRLQVSFPNPFWISLALSVVVVSGTALGMLLSCLFLVTRHGLAWSGALMYPVFIVAGLLIPPEVLPVWLRWVPSIISLHWVHEFVTGTTAGSVPLVPLALASGLASVYLVVAVFCLRLAVDTGRRKGSLDLR